MFLSKHIAFSRRRPEPKKVIVIVDDYLPPLPLSIVRQRVYSPLHRMAEADRYIHAIRSGDD